MSMETGIERHWREEEEAETEEYACQYADGVRQLAATQAFFSMMGAASYSSEHSSVTQYAPMIGKRSFRYPFG